MMVKSMSGESKVFSCGGDTRWQKVEGSDLSSNTTANAGGHQLIRSILSEDQAGTT